MTTCPVVCVARADDCPTACDDSESGWNISSGISRCVTGSCETDCSQYDEVMDNPCTCPLFPIACPRVVDYYDDCFEKFQLFYDGNVCPEEESGPTPQVSTAVFYTVFCTWMSAVTLLIVCWCWYNEKLCPGYSATSMRLRKGAQKSTGDAVLYQHGYRRCILGTTIYALVIITIIGIQFLFFFLTICYYLAVGSITRWDPVFNDYEQVLRVFVMAWLVGFAWSISISYVSIGLNSLFLRRCSLLVATHVLVVAPAETISLKQRQISFSVRCTSWLSYPLSALRRTLLPIPGHAPGKCAIFCRVSLDKSSGNRWISYQLRRYVFDPISGGYMPGYINVGKTLGDFAAQAQGLSTHEAVKRTGIVGLNKAMMSKPTFVSSLAAEFSKKFYVYQVFILWALFYNFDNRLTLLFFQKSFILWTWFINFYFPSGIFLTVLRIAAGMLSAYFRWTGDTSLYKLTQVEGFTKYVINPSDTKKQADLFSPHFFHVSLLPKSSP
jgi:hypothetical protein